MTNYSMPTLIGLFIAGLTAMSYAGGLDTGKLFVIYGALLVSIAAVSGASSENRNASSAANSNHQLKTTRGKWPALFATASVIYVIALSAAVFASPTPAVVAEQASAMGLLAVTYCVVRVQLRRQLAWESIWLLFRFLAVALALLALIERLLVGDRAYAFMSDPNVLAGFFNVFILIGFASSVGQLRESKKKRQGGKELIALFLFAAAQGATGSLSGLVSLFAMLPLLAVFAAKGLAWRHRSGILALAALTLMLAVTSSGGTTEPPAVKLKGISEHSSFIVRLEMVRSSLAIYRDHPWYGSGLGSYKLYYPNYRSPLDSGTSGDLVHNDYVQFLQEGGPLLLAALLLLAVLVLTRTTVIVLRGWRDEPAASQLIEVGQGFALLALLLHAAMNFIFYVAPLALIFGVVLAGFVPAPQTITKHGTSLSQKLTIGLVLFAAGLGITATLGARSLFLAVTQQRCDLHACQLLRSDPVFIRKLASYLAATQPTWLPVRDYLISNSLATEEAVSDPQEKTRWRANAFREALSLLQDTPTTPWPYITLADLIGRDESLAAKMPDGLPLTDVGLYRLALLHNPLDLKVRLQLSKRLMEKGKNDEAYLLLDQVMPHWTLALWGDGGRMQLLVQMTNLAVTLHRCEEAAAMSAGLNVFLKLQREAASNGMPLPTPPGGLPPPSAREGEKAVSLAGACI